MEASGGKLSAIRGGVISGASGVAGVSLLVTESDLMTSCRPFGTEEATFHRRASQTAVFLCRRRKGYRNNLAVSCQHFL